MSCVGQSIGLLQSRAMDSHPSSYGNMFGDYKAAQPLPLPSINPFDSKSMKNLIEKEKLMVIYPYPVGLKRPYAYQLPSVKIEGMNKFDHRNSQTEKPENSFESPIKKTKIVKGKGTDTIESTAFTETGFKDDETSSQLFNKDDTSNSEFSEAPMVENKTWTLEEDRTLLNLYNEYGSQWANMCKYLPRWNRVQIKTRFRSLKRACTKVWKEEEDEIVMALIKDGEEKNFKKLKDLLPGRSKYAISKRVQYLKTNSSESSIDRKINPSPPISAEQLHASVHKSNSNKSAKKSIETLVAAAEKEQDVQVLKALHSIKEKATKIDQPKTIETNLQKKLDDSSSIDSGSYETRINYSPISFGQPYIQDLSSLQNQPIFLPKGFSTILAYPKQVLYPGNLVTRMTLGPYQNFASCPSYLYPSP